MNDSKSVSLAPWMHGVLKFAGYYNLLAGLAMMAVDGENRLIAVLRRQADGGMPKHTHTANLTLSYRRVSQFDLTAP